MEYVSKRHRLRKDPSLRHHPLLFSDAGRRDSCRRLCFRWEGNLSAACRPCVQMDNSDPFQTLCCCYSPCFSSPPPTHWHVVVGTKTEIKPGAVHARLTSDQSYVTQKALVIRAVPPLISQMIIIKERIGMLLFCCSIDVKHRR